MRFSGSLALWIVLGSALVLAGCPKQLTVTGLTAVTGVTLDHATLTVPAGGPPTVLTAVVDPAEATDTRVTWASSDSTVAAVSSAGIVTPISLGAATITVTTRDGTFAATCAVTVSASQTVSVAGVALDATTLALSAGGVPAILTPVIAPADATDKRVSWLSSSATVATVSAVGLVTPLAAGSTTITATTNDGTYTATSLVTVTAAQVTGVYLDHTTLTVPMGGTATIVATVVPSYALNTAVAWQSSNTGIATVSGGTVTPVGIGRTTITATTSDGAKTAVCEVTVVAALVPVTGVTVGPAALDLNVSGASLHLVATVAPVGATNKAVTWSSSNPGAATVSAAGLVAPVAPGTTTITATTADGAKTSACAVTVHAAPITTYVNIETYAGTGAPGYTGDGSPAVNAHISAPTGIAGTPTGDIIFADNGNHVIRKITSSGIISTIAGTGSTVYAADPGPATSATFSSSIQGLTLNGSGDLYIADTSNYVIRRIDHSTGTITTVAGTGGVSGYDTSGTAVATARLGSPVGVAIDSYGDIFIADQGNYMVREVLAADGKVYDVAGIHNSSADGADGLAATVTAIGVVGSIGLDSSGNLVVSATGNTTGWRPRIRKVDLTTGTNGSGLVLNGLTSTIAGGLVQGFSGDTGAATSAAFQIYSTFFLSAATGTFYIADSQNHVIRVIDGTGNVNTVAGIGTVSGYSGDSGSPTAAHLSSPAAVYVDAAGVMYISDTGNNRIRKVN